ncbi:DUF4432 family protein [Pseudarthrobacter oxydans]|uniref:DUF4432 family protein n=1 Tax=Pseudarthrobacter oxydans TaxID=1671 RepID=UPI00344E988F
MSIAERRVTPRELVEAGFAVDAESFLRVYREVVDDGAARGTRVLTVVASGGLTLRVLLDRGMDIGQAWFDGYPVSWQTAVGEVAPGFVNGGQGWLDGWSGGLVTTCGLRNIGSPSEGEGQHGSFTDLPAQNVSITRRWLDDGQLAVDIEGMLFDASSLRGRLVVRRRITLATSSGELEISDRVTNESAIAEQTPILYHVNLGAPFLSADSVIAWRGWNDTERDGVSGTTDMGRPQLVDDRIVELSRDQGAGESGAVVTSPALGLIAEVLWDTDALPRLHTWQRWVPGSFAMSIEPANASLRGRAYDRAEGRAPMLAPGETRRTGVTVRLRKQRGCDITLKSSGSPAERKSHESSTSSWR